MCFVKNITTNRIRNDFAFIKNELNLNIVKEETAKINDCLYVAFCNDKNLEVIIVRDRSYYEILIKNLEGSINLSLICKYLNKSRNYRIEYKGFDGYNDLVIDSKRKIEMLRDDLKNINIKEISQYYMNNKDNIKWLGKEET